MKPIEDVSLSDYRTRFQADKGINSNGEDFGVNVEPTLRIDSEVFPRGGNTQRRLDQIVGSSGYVPASKRAAEMSSQERNATVDDLIATVNANARALKEVRDRVEHVFEQQRFTQHTTAKMDEALMKASQEHRARLDALADEIRLLKAASGLRSLQLAEVRNLPILRWLLSGR